MSSGNFAVVFKMQDTDGKIFALKCFTRDQEGRNESYRLIADELQYVESEYLTKIQYLEKELFVDTGTDDTEFPVLLMDWVDGVTLDKYIKNHINEPACLNLLVGRFGIFADWLLKQPFAHGDLKPDNIIVKDDGSLVIVDYDGMFVPKMRGQKARELGSPDFRHPQRTEDDFDEHIDDFAIVTLLLTIKAIALNPNILEDCNAKDCVLLHTQDFSNLAQSAVNQKLQELIGDSDFARLYAVLVVVLAEKVVDMVMFASVVDKVDLNELEYQYARYLCNEGEGSETNLNYAYKIFEKLSNNNYVDGELCFSCCLKKGYGCHIDEGKSISILTYHANKGNSRAQRNIGYYYESKKEFKNAVEWYTKAAEQGDGTAQKNLGVLYKNGQGVEQNYQKAVEWYTKAAKQENAIAQKNLGFCYYNGQGVEKDYNKAVKWFLKAAKQGNAIAQFCLGYCYATGQGVEIDLSKAVEWYIKAAEQGNDNAQCELGYCYENGKGVEKDYKKAVEWYTMAAEQGNASAQNGLGNCFYNGYGCKKDFSKAVEWYTKAAEQGSARAQGNLGLCYYNGKGIEQDYHKAVEWYTKAAEQGEATAQTNLGFCYINGQGVELYYPKAVEWYTKAAEQGNARAQNNLGVCYENGLGVEQDYHKAVEWYTKAAEQGNANAQNRLGIYYYKGQGVSQNFQTAYFWYRKAADQGNIDAKFWLGVCCEEGHGTNKDISNAIYWYSQAADKGNVNAQNNLGRCYYNRDDIRAAKEWYEKAAEQGNVVSQRMLAIICSTVKRYRDYQAAFKWFSKAAEQGDVISQWALAFCYEKGLGTVSDYKKAQEISQRIFFPLTDSKIPETIDFLRKNMPYW